MNVDGRPLSIAQDRHHPLGRRSQHISGRSFELVISGKTSEVCSAEVSQCRTKSGNRLVLGDRGRLVLGDGGRVILGDM